MFVSQGVHLFFDDLFGLGLQGRVEGGIHLEPGTINRLGIVFLFEQFAYIHDPMWVDHGVSFGGKGIVFDGNVRVRGILGTQANRLAAVAHRNAVFFFRVLVHQSEYFFIPLKGGVAVRKNIINSRGLGQAR